MMHTHRMAALAALVALTPRVSDASWLSEKLEKFIGSYVRTVIEMQIPVERDPLLTDVVNSIAQPLIRAGGRTGVAYRVVILDWEEVNAIAAPAGYMWVTKGCLRFVDSPDELAAVLGHEVSHVTQRHGWRDLKRDLLISTLLGAAAPAEAQPGGLLALWQELDALKHSRHEELDADRLGVDVTFRAGFDYTQALHFLDKLRQEQGDLSRLERYLVTHPTFSERIERLQALPLLAERDLEGLLRLGDALAARRLFGLAAQRYLEALDADPNCGAAHLHLALAYGFLGRHDAAERHYAQALELAPKSGIAVASQAAQVQQTLAVLAGLPQPFSTSADVEEVGTAQAELTEARERIEEVQKLLSEQEGELDKLQEAAEKSVSDARRQFTRLSAAADVRSVSELGARVALAAEAVHRAAAGREMASEVVADMADIADRLSTALADRARCSRRLLDLCQRFCRATELAVADLGEALPDMRDALRGLADPSAAPRFLLPVTSSTFPVAVMSLRTQEIEISLDVELAGPMRRAIAEEIIGQVLRLDPALVRGAGELTGDLGEVALIAAAAKQVGRSPAEFAADLTGWPSVADAIARLPEARPDNLQIAVRLLVSVLRAECEAAARNNDNGGPDACGMRPLRRATNGNSRGWYADRVGAEYGAG